MDQNDLRVKKKKKKIRKKWNLRIIHIFEGILAAGFLLGIIIPLRPEASDLEKRELAEFPALSWEAIWDGSFFGDVSTWFSDTFPFREALLSAESGIENMYGIHTEEIHGNATAAADAVPDAAVTPAPVVTIAPEETESSSAAAEDTASSSASGDASTSESAGESEEVLEDGTIHVEPEAAGTIYISGNTGFEIYYFNQSGADSYASMLNTVRAAIDDSVNIYDIMVPVKFSVMLDDTIQENLSGSNAKDVFAYINSMLDPDIIQVSVIDELIRHNAEYLYFNTDHHWTALGAYYAYVQFCETKGLTANDLSAYTEAVYDNFLGTYYSYSNQSDALASNPDTIYAYLPMGTNDTTVTDENGETREGYVIYDATEYSPGNKYLCFLGGDAALIEIHNPNITDGSSCVLVKESYGNAFAPFLVDHYEYVYVVDYRYYTDNLTDFISSNNIDDVIFLNNAFAISESASGYMLDMFY